MAKGMYMGVSNTARKVKKVYWGVSNIARKVKAMYIGVAGIARKIFSSESVLVYQGRITELLNVGRHYPVQNSSYAFFGHTGGPTAYSPNLVANKSIPVPGRGLDNSAHVASENHFIFAGGRDFDNPTNETTAYNNLLTQVTIGNLPSSRQDAAGAHVAGNCIIAGGYNGFETLNVVNYYNASLVLNTLGPLEFNNRSHLGFSFDSYAIIGGSGETSDATAAVYAYDSLLTRSALAGLSELRNRTCACGTEHYAIFAGGVSPITDELSAAVDAYNTELVKTTAPALPGRTMNSIAVGIGPFALIAGGRQLIDITNYQIDTVVVYDANLVQSTVHPLSVATDSGAAAGAFIGSHALFAGMGASRYVECFTLQ